MNTLLALALAFVSQSSVQIDDDGTIKLKSDGDELVISGILEGAIMDNDANIEKRCDGKSPVKITGNHNHVTLTGECTSVAVMGNDNTVSVARAKTVSVMGNDNEVTVASASAIRVPGNDNTVRWKQGLEKGTKPKITALGRKNLVERI